MSRQNWKDQPSDKWIGVGLILLGALFLFCAICSCTATRDRKAFDRVLSTEKLFDSMGRRWEKENPCVTNDSITYLPGKIDSVLLTLPVIDTGRMIMIRDSLLSVYQSKLKNNNTDCGRQVNEAYDVGYNQARYELSKTKIPDKRPDTALIKKEDLRRIGLLQKDLAFKDGQIAQLKEQNKQLETDKKAEKNRGNKWMWLFIGSVTVSLLITAYKIYRKFKLPVK